MSTEVDIARLEERQRAHADSDDEVHGRMLREVGQIGAKLDTMAERMATLAATLAPVVEMYMAEHPSKVHHVAPAPAAHGSDAKKLGLLLGAGIALLEAHAQARDLIAGWLRH